jgi:AraC-like DNA-binding protein
MLRPVVGRSVSRMRKLIFSSEDLASELDDRARYNLWREVFAWRYGSAEITRLADRPFKARSEFVQLGTLGLLRSETTVQRFKRTSQQAADGAGGYLIAFNNGLSCTAVDQNGNRQVYAPNQIWLGSTADALDVQSKTGTKWVAVVVPPSKLLEMLPNADDLVAKPIDATRPAVRYLRRYIEFLLTADEIGDDNALSSRLDDMLLDLVALSLGANGDAAHMAAMRGLRAARVREILLRIQEGFSSPVFSAQSVAQALGLSARYVQELMQETGTGFTGRVLELRLQKARKMLADPVHDRLKISDLAYACGFNEVSYFNRCFRRRFGASPTQFRS